MSDSFWGISRVWLRYFDVYCKSLFYGLFTTFTEPLLYLLSFGFGLGGLIGKMTVGEQTVTYRQFVFAGIVAQTILFQGFFETAYGGFVRMYYQRIFKAMATTPITLSEVLWGELLWGASKACFGSSAVLLIGAAMGDFSTTGALACLPICFLGSLVFAGMGLWSAAISKTIEELSYPQYLLIFPMFLFCGIFFPLKQLPEFLQKLAWVLPLTPLAALIRSLTLGFAFEWSSVGILMFWGVVFVIASRRTMIRRLVK